MAILDSRALHHVERTLLDYKRDAKRVPNGYPVALITDLLDTIRAMQAAQKRCTEQLTETSKLLAKIRDKTMCYVSGGPKTVIENNGSN